ncbi:RNA polymerase sigma factor [Streptomyces sp. R11]|uniref:RNA polymerase sigma factor n=1 Tax=Streptomyces sp. R11 TaxID=3238625 RepID=A0AB39NC29_9ACTN
MSTTFDASTLEERFSSGDETALPEMYRKFSGPMFVTALSLLGDRELAAEAVQQAFVQAWRAADRFDPKRELQPWLYAITRRAAVDTYRRERRFSTQLPLDESWTGESHFATEGPSMDAAWRMWQVRQALEELHPDERQVLQLAYFEGCTQSEIAVTLGIALGTVKSRTTRAQRRLAQLLAHLQNAEDEPSR